MDADDEGACVSSELRVRALIGAKLCKHLFTACRTSTCSTAHTTSASYNITHTSLTFQILDEYSKSRGALDYLPLFHAN